MAAEFTAIYKAVQPKLQRYLRRFGVQECDIADLVQDCFVSYLGAGRELNMESASAFLITTARNRAIDLWRKQKVAAAEPIEGYQDRLSQPQDEGFSHSIFLERLGVHMDALNIQHRGNLSFRMYYQDGKSLNEIAQDLGEPIGTISGRVFRMRERVRQSWRADLERCRDQLERAGFGT